MTPLLSICVPTYNRASRLRVMLQAVLPQVAEHRDRVELVISDNASPDETPRVVEEARSLGPLRYSRNETNLGIVSSVIKLATELAQGEFVWVLGDDDLLMPGALSRVLAQVEAHRDLDLFYLNFRHANYDPHWPTVAVGGYDGPFTEDANAELSDRPLRQWREIVRGSTCMGTQVYVHVLRRRVWEDYWRDRPRRKDFADARWTFPHAYMIAETLLNDPSYYVGEPVLTIFNGGQSWWEYRHRIVLFNFSGLLRAYEKSGLTKVQLRDCAEMVFANCEPLLGEVLRGEAGPRLPLIFSYLRQNWRFAEGWRAMARAILATGRPRPAALLFRIALKVWKQLLRVRGKLRFETTRLKSTLGRPR